MISLGEGQDLSLTVAQPFDTDAGDRARAAKCVDQARTVWRPGRPTLVAPQGDVQWSRRLSQRVPEQQVGSSRRARVDALVDELLRAVGPVRPAFIAVGGLGDGCDLPVRQPSAKQLATGTDLPNEDQAI